MYTTKQEIENILHLRVSEIKNEALNKVDILDKLNNIFSTKLTDSLLKQVNLDIDYANNFIIKVNTIEELHKAREFLRTILGSWEDEVSSVSSYGMDKGRAVYHIKDNKEVPEELQKFYIEWIFPISETPEEFTKNGCHWETEVYTSRSTAFVCPIGEK